MAKDKKSFLLYTDVMHTITHLTDEQAGQLFKHLLEYVNDEDPVCENPIINIAFEPIKQALKRDLKKYEEIREKKRKAGLASAEKRKQNKHSLTPVESVKHNSTDPTVNDSVSVSDNVINKNTKENKDATPQTAYDYLKLNCPSRVEAFEMKNKKSLSTVWDKLILDFNDKIIIEEIPFDAEKIFSRLSIFTRNYQQNQNKGNPVSGQIAQKKNVSYKKLMEG